MKTLKKVLIGGLLTCCAVVSLFGFTACGSKMVTNEHTINETFENISFNIDTANINIYSSTDGACKVVCYEREKENHTVSVENGTLTISLKDVEWYKEVHFFSKSPKITMYLPAAEYNTLFIDSSTGDVEIAKDFTFNYMDITLSTADVKCYASVKETAKITTSTGGIAVENASVGALNLSLSTGDVHVHNIECAGNISLDSSTGEMDFSNITCKDFFANGSTGDKNFSNMDCKNITIKSSTGDVNLTDVVALEKFSVTVSTGDVLFERCDGQEIFIKTSTGDIKGSLLSTKSFIVEGDKIELPETVTGGKCELRTNTGKIKITIVE